MLLKQLDLVGFKSFADRVNIEFVPGVTAIVGPNGSGKSNISDAIRWVLGEQSAKSLRGGKMEDIIFSGSDARKPLNVAEVTLTLDNEDQYLPLDYNEISVTRRIYRSGDSEYLINKQPCRLKDIVDLFLDTGLGREAYSVIGQGKIDEILNSKAEDKRKIFEEAAGVLKYKTRKEKAEKKLLETEENLARVDDILCELNDQIEPLQIQASVAKDYLQKKEELEDIEVALIVHEIEEEHKKWKDLSETVETLRNKELEVSAAISAEEAEIETKRADMQAWDESIEALQADLLVASEELEKLEGQKEVLKERMKNAGKNRDLLKDRIASAKKNIEENANGLEAKQAALHEAEKTLAQTKGRLQEESATFADLEQDTESELERLKTEYIEVLNEQASVRNELRYLEEQRTQLKAKNRRLDEVHENYIKERERLKERKAECREQWKRDKQQLEDAREAYRKLQEELESDTKTLRRKEASFEEVKTNEQQLASRKDVLEAMREDYSGFFHGVKEVLKARRSLSGIEGAIAELIRVPKPYEAAMETALGGAMQHVVVEREEHARAAINHLKTSGRGRATFLPLSVIKPRTLPDRDVATLRSHHAFIGVASELVSADARYEKVVRHLLGNVVVAEDLKGANDLARLLHHRVRIVTLDGDIVNPGGSMAGGSRKKQKHSLLGRERELEEVNKRLEDATREAAELESEMQAARQSIHDGQARLEELRESGETLRLTVQKHEGEMRELDIEEKNLNERLTLYDREKKEYREELEAIDERTGTLEASARNITVSEKQLDAQITDLTEKKKEQEASKEAAQSVMTELKVKAAEEEQHVAHLREAIDELTAEKQKHEQQLREAEEALRHLEDEMNDHSSGEDELDGSIEAKRKEKQAITERISRARGQRLNVQEETEDRERELREKKRVQKQRADMLKAEEVKLTRLDVELDNRLNMLREEYELSFEAAKANYPLTVEASEARKQVKLIKRAIDDLGTVNLGAIEEYERVSDRVRFLTEQKEDLQRAKQDLQHVIAEMDEEVVKRFEETFTDVREHFQSIFKELFGGGRADLRLSDPDDLLHTGVDVVAQPPGKKLQHLALLSGGERALTAITLLFAILKVRPVPFCVLDEVEAALDEANVGRFAQYLKTFSMETQFVIVTHRRGTMEEADVLYGVTMQRQSGISDLVSVRLEETKQLVETS